MTTSKPLVVLCAGKTSLHRINRWHLKEKRNFELWIVAYDSETPTEGADWVVFRTGPKWDLIRSVSERILEKNPSWLWLPDDDLSIDVTSVNTFFEMFEKEDDKIIAQPSLTPQNVSCVELVHIPGGTPWRDVGFIEIQMPCFCGSLVSRLLDFVHDHDENKSGWGLDCVWSCWPGISKRVINCVVAVHTRPVNCSGGFYSRYGIDPVAERDACLQKNKFLFMTLP